jgi:thiopeptide-type bacteriocin biosynthesis protein
MKRNFGIGSEWLYYKIYTGVKIADTILSEHLYPVIQQLMADGTIEQWFFIRYNDPDNHLRLRFYSPNLQNLLQVIAVLHPVFDALLQNDSIWKLQTDVYQREIERYGEATMTQSEAIFCQDSEMMLHYMAHKPYFEKEEEQLLFSCAAIDSFLTAFHQTLNEKFLLLQDLQEAFKEEHNADKTLKKELDKHYRELAQEIDSALSEQENNTTGIYNSIIEKQNKLAPLVSEIREKIQIPLADFLSSHIHMIVNRQYTSKQRKYECIIYDHLFRHYKKAMGQNAYREASIAEMR